MQLPPFTITGFSCCLPNKLSWQLLLCSLGLFFHSLFFFCIHVLFLQLQCSQIFLQPFSIFLLTLTHPFNHKIAVFTVYPTPIFPLLLLFVGRYLWSAPVLGQIPLCIVYSFLFFLSFSSSCIMDHFKDGLMYLTTDMAQLLMALKRFLLFIFFSNTFLTLQQYSFFAFSFHQPYLHLLATILNICSSHFIH